MPGAGLDPQGRVIMISGANRGIGAAVARQLYGAGYGLSLGARDPSALAGVVADMDEGRVMSHAFEARAAASAEAWVAATAARFGRIDGLVNNAGVYRNVTLDEGDEAALDEMWEVNVKAPFRLTRLALPHLRRSGAGRVVNVTSLSGVRYKGGSVGYTISKFAAQGLTHGTRYAGWEDGVRVTAICPGATRTDMGVTNIPMAAEKMTSPESVAALIAMALALPNDASVVEIPVNCVLEATC